MPRAHRYYVEFEFWSSSDQLFWFPLLIHAESRSQAESYAARIKAGLLANHQVLRDSRVTPVTTGLTSGTMAEYRKARASGIPALLNVNRWTTRSVNDAPRVDFQTQTTDEVEKLLATLELPATLTASEPRHCTANLTGAGRAPREEFLLLKVVGPSD